MTEQNFPAEAGPFLGKHPKRTRLILNSVFLLITAALAFVYFKTARLSMVDDSYITFRYAQNLADGNGLVFNVGERFYGSTAMGFAVLLGSITALIHKVQAALNLTPLMPLPHVAVLISALSLWLIWFVWYRILVHRRFSLARWAGGLAVALYYFNVSYSKITPGHETYTYFAFLLLAAYLFFDLEAYLSAGVILALSVMIRPDALLFAGLVFAIAAIDHFILQRRKFSELGPKLSSLAVFGVLAAAWEIFLKAYFGSWIPETMLAKKAQVILDIFTPFSAGSLVTSIRERGFPGFFLVLSAAVILFIGLLLFNQFRDLDKASSKKTLVLLTALWLLHGVGLAAAYISFGVSHWAWYETSIYYSLVGVVVISFVLFTEWLKPYFAPENLYQSLVIGTAITAMIATSYGVYKYIDLRWESPRVWGHIFSYDPLVEYLHQAEPDGTTIAVPEPGALGYKLGEEYFVIDYLGLISPGVAEALIAGDQDYYYQRWHPEYILIVHEAVFAPQGQRWFEENYQLIGEFEHPWWEERLGRGVYLYQLIDGST